MLLSPLVYRPCVLWRKGQCLVLRPFSGLRLCAQMGLSSDPPTPPLAFWRFQNVPCLPRSKSQLQALGKYRARKTTAMLTFSTCWKNRELATDPSQLWMSMPWPRAGWPLVPGPPMVSRQVGVSPGNCGSYLKGISLQSSPLLGKGT